MARVSITTDFYPCNSAFERSIWKTTLGKIISIYDAYNGVYDRFDYRTSIDGGTTWSSATTIFTPTGSNPYVSWFDSFMDNNNNIYLVLGWGNDADDYISFVKLTYSAGTWSIGSIILVTTGTRQSSITLRSNGDVWISHGATYEWSTNDGATWTSHYISANHNYSTVIPVSTNIWLIAQYYANQLRQYPYGTPPDFGLETVIALSGITNSARNFGCVKVSDSEIWVTGRTSSGIKIYKYNGSVWNSGTLISASSTDTMPSMCYAGKPVLVYSTSGHNIYYRVFNGASWDVAVAMTTDNASDYPNSLYYDSQYLYVLYKTGTTLYFDKVQITIPPAPEIIENDTITLSDDLNLNTEDYVNLNLSDNFHSRFNFPVEEITTLSDIIDITKIKSQEEIDNISLSDIIEARIPIEFIHNITSFVIQTIKNINNKFSMLKSNFINCTNEILFRKQGIYSCKNDFRMRGAWQVPANGGIQSLGKEYIKVYIATVEQTDIDIDSISITKGLNNAHTANLILGRAYDATAPDIESVIEIKYSNWTLFKGYITQIIPTDNPENIQLYCEDEMWKQNKTRVYFQVGHLPYGASPDQYFYKYTNLALSTLGINVNFGGICPQTINCWGKAKSEAITDLITQSGNFGWFYNENGTPNYWRAGEGSVINLEAQEIGKNLSLYQVLSHSFKSEVSSIINRLRVQMGVFVNGLNQAYQSYDYEYFAYQPTPSWDSSLEILATPANALGFDYFHHKPENNYLYDNVFKKYKLSNESDLELALSKWTDRYTPRVSISGGGFGWVCSRKDGEQTDGFSIDYKKNGSITFNEPVYYKQLNEYGEVVAVRRAQVYVSLYKKKLHATSNNPAYPMWFYTGVMGSYPITNTGDLSLSGLSIQSGGRYKDENGDYKYIPSWNDTAFASDVANWELSKNCDEKISGNITLTLDAVCFYNIDLSKRILIPGIQDTPLNIINMSYNLSDFTVTLQLESARSYYRSASIQSRGEDYF